MLKGTGTLASKSRLTTFDSEHKKGKKKFETFFFPLALFLQRKGRKRSC